MALFKQVKKPEIRNTGSGGDVSSSRPVQVEKTAPCIHTCTVNNYVRDWIVPLAQYGEYGRTEDEAFAVAWNTITKLNPFPAVSGRVCQHPCESGCNRKGKDGPVAIRDLERFVGDFAISHQLKLASLETTPVTGKIAIVGAGPSGMSCAYRLAQLGCSVVVFDAAPLPGGMMRYRISPDRLPLSVVEYETQNILNLGVEFRGSCVVGRDISVETLTTEYQAVIYAIGLQKAAQIQRRKDEHGAWVIGELPATLPEALAETTTFAPSTLNMVTPSIAQGFWLAEEIVAALDGKEYHPSQSTTVIKTDHLKLDWYPSLDRLNGVSAQGNGAIASDGLSAKDAIAEATRCMSCGMCMDCGSCWMYCSNSCFVKMPKGEHYTIRLDLCNGCNKCVEACPCGYLEMQ